MRPSRHRRVVLLAGLALLVAGCGGSSTAAGPTVARDHPDDRCQRVAGAARWEGVVRAGSSTTTLDEYDDYFVPTCVVVPWNKPVTLVVTNLGQMPHTVTVRGTPVDVDVDAGQTAFVKVPATKRPLRIVCTFHVDERMFAAVVPTRGAAT
jgi:hypothetical protein